jgi:alkylhydroperoxidase family enzyme
VNGPGRRPKADVTAPLGPLAQRSIPGLAEQGTRIADGAGGVTNEAWANAAKHYDDDQLAALVCAIATINAYNRFNVICQNQGGDYKPGQWG